MDSLRRRPSDPSTNGELHAVGFVEPNLRIFGLTDSTCDDCYGDSLTATQAVPIQAQKPVIAIPTVECHTMVTVRVGDVLSSLAQSAGRNLAWIEDFRDDPIAITKDLHDVLLAYQRIRRAA